MRTHNFEQANIVPPEEDFGESLQGLHDTVEMSLILSNGLPNKNVFNQLKKHLNPELQSWEQWSLFVANSIAIATTIGVQPNDLLWLISFESYTVKNPRRYFDTGYHTTQKDVAGLLSFRESGVKISSFARLLGKESKNDVHLEDVVGLTVFEQLELVEAYLVHWIAITGLESPISFDDLYLIIRSPKYVGMSDEEVVAAGKGSDYVADIEEEIACLENCKEEEKEFNMAKVKVLTARKDSMIDRFNKNSGWDRQSERGHMEEVQKKELTTQLINNVNIQHHKREYVKKSD